MGATSYHLDFETFSECDIGKGGYRYAADKSTMILLAAVAADGESPVIWDRYASADENRPALERIRAISADSTSLVTCHNAQGFEIPMSSYHWLKTFHCQPPPPDSWRCTAARCRKMAYPHRLDLAAEFLGLREKKDKTGDALIKIFSQPCKKTGVQLTPLTEGKVTVCGNKITYAEAWKLFRDYCIQDVRVEMQIDKHPAVPELKGALLDAFQLDLRINARGIPVNLDGLRNAQKITDECLQIFSKQFKEITGLNPTQTKSVLPWLQERGYQGRNLQSKTMAEQLKIDPALLRLTDDEEEDEQDEQEETLSEYPLYYIVDRPEHLNKGVLKPAQSGVRINAGAVLKADTVYKPGNTVKISISKNWVSCKVTGVEFSSGQQMTVEAHEALRLRALSSFAVIKKIPVMLDSAVGGRMRGMFMYYGAIRTGRSSAKGVQPHNFRRPSLHLMEFTADAYSEICRGISRADMEMLYGNPVEMIASCMRHFIHDDIDLLDADFSQIEARVLAWLAGYSRLLRSFREGRDLYKETASTIYGTPYDRVSKPQRTIGKVAALALGYNGGSEAFITMGRNNNVEVPEEKEVKRIVKLFRENNKPIPALWKEMQSAAVKALRSSKEAHQAGPFIKFKLHDPDNRAEETMERYRQWRSDYTEASVEQRHRIGAPKMIIPNSLLQMILPSGRRLTYPRPGLTLKRGVYKDESGEVRKWWIDDITFYGTFPASQRWGRVSTFGGRLTENACQATAGDFLTHGVLNAEKAGYEVFMVIHDQALCRHEKGLTAEGFRNALIQLPSWAAGFPLDASADVVPFYRKD